MQVITSACWFWLLLLLLLVCSCQKWPKANTVLCRCWWLSWSSSWNGEWSLLLAPPPWQSWTFPTRDYSTVNQMEEFHSRPRLTHPGSERRRRWQWSNCACNSLCAVSLPSDDEVKDSCGWRVVLFLGMCYRAYTLFYKKCVQFVKHIISDKPLVIDSVCVDVLSDKLHKSSV